MFVLKLFVKIFVKFEFVFKFVFCLVGKVVVVVVVCLVVLVLCIKVKVVEYKIDEVIGCLILFDGYKLSVEEEYMNLL